VIGLQSFIRAKSAVGIFADAADQVPQLRGDDSLPEVFMSKSKAAEKMIVKEMAERSMADIVKQSRQTHQAFDVSKGRSLLRPTGFDERWIKAANRSTAEVHGAENVLEAGMLGARINPPGALQLMNPSQTLHPGMIDERLLGRLPAIAGSRENDVSVHRITQQALGSKLVSGHTSLVLRH
jgi:hypothetical protein